MHTITYSTLLRFALRADALISGVVGLTMWLAGESLATWFNVPATLIRGAGLVLLPWAVLVGWLAQRRQLASAAVWVVIVVNVLWAIDCVLLITLGDIAPSASGYGFFAIQIVAVVVFAELQYVGLRRSRLAI